MTKASTRSKRDCALSKRKPFWPKYGSGAHSANRMGMSVALVNRSGAAIYARMPYSPATALTTANATICRYMMSFQMTILPLVDVIAFAKVIAMGTSSVILKTLLSSGRIDMKCCREMVCVAMINAGEVVDIMPLTSERWARSSSSKVASRWSAVAPLPTASSFAFCSSHDLA